MDPLSEILSLLKLDDWVSGGFVVGAKVGFEFPRHPGIKCYAAASGSCWLLFKGPLSASTMRFLRYLYCLMKL
jgi:hypothetical protein